MKAFVDRDTCIGCENCVGDAPEVFEMVDGLAMAKDMELDGDTLANAETAKDGCPVEAISIS